jgi:dienelactone hydrolase
LEDAEEVRRHVLARADVDTARLLVAGVSRGGILAAAHAARHPAAYRGVVNFVGGWIGEGCADAVAVNRTTFSASAVARTPMLWLYGESDPFYSVAQSRANFEAFERAGGTGTFFVFRRANPSASGHFIINGPSLWSDRLGEFLGPLER